VTSTEPDNRFANMPAQYPPLAEWGGPQNLEDNFMLPLFCGPASGANQAQQSARDLAGQREPPALRPRSGADRGQPLHHALLFTATARNRSDFSLSERQLATRTANPDAALGEVVSPSRVLPHL
jgi:hypothetical protein